MGSLENVRGGVGGTVEGEGGLKDIGVLLAKDGVAVVEVLVFFQVNDNLLSLAHFRALLRPFDDTVRKCRPKGVAVTCSAALLPEEIWTTAIAEGTRKWEERKERSHGFSNDLGSRRSSESEWPHMENSPFGAIGTSSMT